MHRFFLASAVFSGAFLLFQVQPLTGKIILPWFGGSAAVWSTCLLFFQTVLWLGYVYAHFLVRTLRPSRQAIVHVSLLTLSLSLLPIALKPAATSAASYLSVLTILGVSVGIPYFLLAAGGPLMQAWYAELGTGIPYRLFSLSNLASLAGLVAYPFLVEPFTATATQTSLWSWAYAATIFLTAAAAAPLLTRLQTAPRPASLAPDVPSPTLWARCLWVLLPACASSLLVGITTDLTQNVAPLPLLWIVRLSLYLASFIICFERDGWYDPELYRLLLAGALVAIAVGTLRRTSVADHRLLVAWFSIAFFLCCMFCHGELALRKPHPKALTKFYLTISFGGALGGIFATLLAPLLFPDYHEVPITLVVIAVLAVLLFHREGNRLWRFWTVLTIVLAALLLWGAARSAAGVRRTARNFYGVLRVTDDSKGEVRALMHGTVNHGEQFLDAPRRNEPTTYYSRASGAGLALRHGCPAAGCRVGLIGLGAGTLAAYSRAQDTYRFYEINPEVIQIARTEFTFLSDAPAPIEIALGDARLSLEKEPPQKYDVLIVDAFSGDSVPVHLVTREAANLYLRHLKPDGILAMHVSNNFLDLPPLLHRVFETAGKPMLLVQNPPDPESHVLFSEWVLLTANKQFLALPEVTKAAKPVPEKPGIVAWTDDYSNLLQLLR